MELIKFSHDELTKPIQGGFAQSVKSSIYHTDLVSHLPRE